jgi:predicted metal-dependent peptidase
VIDLATTQDAVALARLRESLFDLVVSAPLCGLTLCGRTLQIKEDANERTMATDGQTIWYSPKWVRARGREDVTFGLAHEWVHVFGNHLLRRGARQPTRWNRAADVCANHTVLRILPNAKLPAGLVPAYPGMEHLIPEEIYKILEEAEKEEGAPKEEEPPDDLRGEPPADTRAAEAAGGFAREFTAELAQVAAVLRNLGTDIPKAYGSYVATRLLELARGTVPWERWLLGEVCAALGSSTATWSPPSYRIPGLVLPRRIGKKERHLLIAVDVSASVDAALLRRFSSNIANAALRATRTTLVTFDDRVRSRIEAKHPRALLSQLRLVSGEHRRTASEEVFQVAEQAHADVVVVLTDGYVSTPKIAYPATFWAVPQGGPTMPWGTTIHLQSSW